jgi:hypothetical protein
VPRPRSDRPETDRYDDKRTADLGRQRSMSAAGREIGPLPPVADPDRRELCRDDLELFAVTYFPARFYLAFSPVHRTVIDRMHRCTEGGGLFACAMPRAFGKSMLAEVATVHAILYGRRRFVLLVAATERHAGQSLKRITAEFETNDLLAADFPEACFPVRALGRIHNRAKGQTLDGRPTRIDWTADGLTLPTVAGAPSSGAVVRVTGLTGAIRGLNALDPDGKPIRPDLVVIDDPQTRESAKSLTQTADREAVISDDVLQLAGPTTTIAAFMLCTVIYKSDLSDRFLDADRHPEWQGVRTKMVERFPDALDLWDEYQEVRRESFRSGDEGRRANEFYAANRERMDAGAVVTWAERVKDGDLSGVQTAMNFRLDNPRGFFAEGQNDPQAADPLAGAKEFHAEAVAARFSGSDHLAVPRECVRLTAFIDPGLTLLWYAVVAWNDRGGGAVIDYGCYPRQGRTWFEARDARPSLADTFEGRTEPQLVFAGLDAVAPEVLGRTYYREGKGDELKVERALIDCGWQPAAVFQWIRQSGYFAVVYPSKGIGRTATARGVAEWKPRPGERSGWHWRLTIPESGRVRMVQFDPDQWKTRLHGLLTVPLGGPTGLTLFGKAAAQHEMIGAHCAAEYSSPVTIRGETFDKWEVRPDRPDNHLLDCLVGCSVAAGVAGVQWSARDRGEPEPPKQAAPRKKWSEMQAEKMAGRAR